MYSREGSSPSIRTNNINQLEWVDQNKQKDEHEKIANPFQIASPPPLQCQIGSIAAGRCLETALFAISSLPWRHWTSAVAPPTRPPADFSSNWTDTSFTTATRSQRRRRATPPASANSRR